MKIRIMIVPVAIAVVLGGCENMTFTKADQGMVIGGVLGGLGGSMLGGGRGSIIGAIAGTFAGGYLGREVGRYMDRQDVTLHEKAVGRTVVYGENSTWSNSQTGHRGRVEAGRHYQTPLGYCREYTETITIDGRPVSAHGTACQERDGSWRIKNR